MIMETHSGTAGTVESELSGEIPAEILAQHLVCSPGFGMQAIGYLLRRLAVSPDEIQNLVDCISKDRTCKSKCVKLPAPSSKSDGQVKIGHPAKVKLPLKIVALRLWTCPKIHQRKVAPLARDCSLVGCPEFVCGNPFHYEVLIRKRKNYGQSCIVFGCPNRSGSRDGFSFFKTPDKETKNVLYREWFALCARKDLTEFSRYHLICSHHFVPSDIIKRGSITTLRDGAVPVLRMPLPLRTSIRHCAPTRTIQQELEISRRRFWVELSASSFDVWKLDSQESGWRKLNATVNVIVISRVRFSVGCVRDGSQTVSDIISIKDDLTVSLYSGNVLIRPASYVHIVRTGHVENSNVLRKLMAYSFEPCDAVAVSPTPAQSVSTMLSALEDAIVDIKDLLGTTGCVEPTASMGSGGCGNLRGNGDSNAGDSERLSRTDCVLNSVNEMVDNAAKGERHPNNQNSAKTNDRKRKKLEQLPSAPQSQPRKKTRVQATKEKPDSLPK